MNTNFKIVSVVVSNMRTLSCWCVVLIVQEFLFGEVYSVPPPPNWPPLYKTCVNVQSEREFIRAGWYVNTEEKRMRLDSYGIPKGLNESTAELLQHYISQVENFEYACPQYGPPLYIFIYLYDQGKMLSLFPSPEPPYRTCKISSIFHTFPNSPLLPGVEFVEITHDNVTTYNHWRAESFLFTLDYMFHVTSGLPYKLLVNSEENLFLSFEEGYLDDSTFYPPSGITCNSK